jgi:hypothetical protein
MPNALKKAGGRPRKYATAEEARLAKLKCDRERRQRLMKKPTALSDDNKQPIPPEPALQMPVGPQWSPIPSPSPSKKRKFDGYFKYNPHTLLFEASTSDSDNGGHIVEGSGGGHIDEGHTVEGSRGGHTDEGYIIDGSGGGYIDDDLYGVVGGDQEV